MYELDQTSKSSVRILIMKKLLLRRITGQLELIDQKDPESFRLEKLYSLANDERSTGQGRPRRRATLAAK